MARVGEQDIRARFAERYRSGTSDVTIRMEVAVIGSNWGANGYTTVDEANKLGDVLCLGPGVRLLDLGAGRGWPGLYLAATTGCEVVLLDPPIEGISLAVSRAQIEGISDRAVAVAGSACDLPVASSSLDAVVHTDTLCCLRGKHRALHESLRVLRPGGRTAFTAIHLAPGLQASERRRAARDGPVAVATPRSYLQLLGTAGFVDVQARDCTASYERVEAAWLDQQVLHAAELTEMLGPDAYAERVAARRAELGAIRDGLLCRTLFVAHRPRSQRGRARVI